MITSAKVRQLLSPGDVVCIRAIDRIMPIEVMTGREGGYTVDKGNKVRHDAQQNWNEAVKANE